MTGPLFDDANVDQVGPEPVAARWLPDDLIVAAVASSPKAPKPISGYTGADRAWLVAGLTAAGLTAADIAGRLSCSVRLVKFIRAEELTAVCVWAQRTVRRVEDRLRAEAVAHQACRQELAMERARSAKLDRQVDELFAALASRVAVELFRCGHAKVPGNVYRNRGVDRCRRCRCKNSIAYYVRRSPRPLAAV